MTISTRTPEGEPIRCPVCGKHSSVELSLFAGDALCPFCGTLVWPTLLTQSVEVLALVQNRFALQSQPVRRMSRQQWQRVGERLRAIGVAGGLAAVASFLLFFVLVACGGDPSHLAHHSPAPPWFAAWVISVFAGCIASLLLLLTGAAVSSR